jgi:hypothetical protein
MPASRSHYRILNVAPDAEPVVIEAAYRALMKKYHPDQAASASAGEGPRAAEINLAYATLRDPGRRADYDRREGARAQNIQLAAYQPPPPQRISRVFGWGGWVVATIMGGVLALMASQANEVALARADAARAAAPAEPDLRSQPTLPDEPFAAPASLAAVPPDAVPVAPPPADPAPVAQAVPLEKVRAQQPRSQRKAGSSRPPRAAAQPKRSRSAREKDFLEREGYIY